MQEHMGIDTPEKAEAEEKIGEWQIEESQTHAQSEEEQTDAWI